jgi:hypothetical protein
MGTRFGSNELKTFWLEADLSMFLHFLIRGETLLKTTRTVQGRVLRVLTMAVAPGEAF